MSSSIVSISSRGQFDGILKSSRIVVADFYADSSAPSKQIAPLYQTLAETLSHPNAVTFVRINSEDNKDIAEEYSVSVLPTFLVFRGGKVIENVQGANRAELQKMVEKLAVEVQSLRETAGNSSAVWQGAEIPRGYGDVKEQIEVKGCELLNADEDAGPVQVLFEPTKPSALSNGKNTSKDWVQSGSDDQLLLFIPFQSTIKLHTLQITSLPPDDDDSVSRPGVLHLFINRTANMDFGEAEDTEPTQAISLEEKDWNTEGTANVNLRFVKFQKTSTLTVFVQRGNGEADTVRIDRIRLIGEAGAKREMGQLQKIDDEE